MRLWIVLICVLPGCMTARRETYVAKRREPIVLRAESERLSELGEAAREKKPSEKHEQRNRRDQCSDTRCSKCNSSPCTCDSDSGNLAGQIFGQAILATVAAPFAIPMTLLNDDHNGDTQFPAYPYAGDLPGSLILTSHYDGTPRTWNGNLQAFAIPETDDIDRYGGRLVLDSVYRWGLDTETNYWKQSGGSSSQTWTGDANFTFRFAESEHVQMRAGFGVN